MLLILIFLILFFWKHCCWKCFVMKFEPCVLLAGDHVRQDSMDFSKEWEDPANCRCSDRLKPLERRKARQHQRCLAHSLVGTPNYIAPEVLLRTGTVDRTCLMLLL